MVQANTRKPFNVKFTDAELKLVRIAAEKYGEQVSPFIRRIVLREVMQEND